MGAPGYTIFCRNGHIVQHVPHHCVVDHDPGTCPTCGCNETYNAHEWGDESYGSHAIPYDPIHTTTVLKPVVVPVFDVSKVRWWKINTPNETRVCKECNRDFVLKGGEIDFYTRSKLELPVRCPECRLKRKQAIKKANGFYDEKAM